MSTRIRFALTPLALAAAFASMDVGAATKVYTLNADFDLGVLTGVNHNTPAANQLQLNVTGSSFPVLWIANGGEDTLSKVDSNQVNSTVPGKEVARYRTWFDGTAVHIGDAWGGAAPSRTAVDKDGNAYVANRGFQNYGYPGWAYVFKVLNSGFIDRNGNGTADTSTDTSGNGRIEPSEMKPLTDTNTNGVIEASELKDERVAWAVRVPDGVYKDANGAVIPPRQNSLARALCIGTDGNLWVGMYNGYEYWKISAVDGHTMAGPVRTNYPNYGCLIDQNGNLWGASWQYGVLLRIENTGSNTGPYPYSQIGIPSAAYGLALRRDQATNAVHVIMGGSCNSYVDYNVATNSWSQPAAVNYCSYAVGTDNDGNILVSKTGGGVVKFNPSGGVIWDKGSQVGSADSRGVIADANNNIWQVHNGANAMSKFDGATGASMGVLPVGAQPYTYSDASGTAALSVTTKTGSWAVVQDGGANGTPWTKVAWNGTVPTGAGLTTEVRTSDSSTGLLLQPFVPVANGAALSGLAGRYMQVRVTFNANTANQSPVLYDLSVTSGPTTCDVNNDGKVDKTDVNLIAAAIGQTPAANDPRDATGDGKITINDVRACTLKCTNANCAP